MPQPPFTEEHEEFRRVVRRWVETELAPHADEWEASHHFPDDVFRRCAEQGYLGLKIEEEWGGQGGGYVAEAVFVEELQRCRAGGLAAGIGTHICIGLTPIWRHGTDDQRRRFVVPGVAGERIGALAVTEPDGGSDVANLKTRARRVDGGWLVNGSKLYISNGVRADFIITAARTGGEGHRGVSLLIIEPKAVSGVTANALQKMGCRAGDTAELFFEDVFVSEENLLGAENEGFRLLMGGFEWERIHMSLVATGIVAAWIEPTIAYVKQRHAFGGPLSDKQVVRHKIADVATTLHVGRTVTYEALRRYVCGEGCAIEVTMAKLATQTPTCQALDTMLQLHGGAGYMEEYGIERAYRDARLGPIGGGTDDIMREILAKALL